MTKAELIESVASKVDLPRATAERAVNTLFDDIVAALQQGDKVNISGFGTFSVSIAEGTDRAQSEDWGEHRNLRVTGGQVQGRQDPEGFVELSPRRTGG